MAIVNNLPAEATQPSGFTDFVAKTGKAAIGCFFNENASYAGQVIRITVLGAILGAITEGSLMSTLGQLTSCSGTACIRELGINGTYTAYYAAKGGVYGFIAGIVSAALNTVQPVVQIAIRNETVSRAAQAAAKAIPIGILLTYSLNRTVLILSAAAGVAISLAGRSL